MADRDWVDAVLEPRPEDSSDVRWALETALAMWSRGDRDQAVRWIENAVHAATGEGAHERAQALGRAAGELGQRPPPRPVTSPSTPASLTSHELAPRTAPMGDNEEGPATHKRPSKNTLRTAPYKIAPDEVTNMFAPDSKLLAELRSAGPETVADPSAPPSDTPAPAAVPARPRPPTTAMDSLDASITDFRREAPAPDLAERTVVMDEEDVPPSPRSSFTKAPSTMGSLGNSIEPMRALRVVIESGTGRQIVLRLLDEGEAPPDGAQEALLVALGRARR